jgi:hypothetical protein
MAGRKGEKWWRDAIRVAITEKLEGDDAGRTKLRAAADMLVAKAIEGDVTALKEIGDRLDGKATQEIDLEGRVSVERVKVEFVRAAADKAG